MSKTISELISIHGKIDNIPNQELYDFLASPETRSDLSNLALPHNSSETRDAAACLDEFKSRPFVHSVRKKLVTDPRFSAGMSPELRADMTALFFPEYANA